MTEHDAKNDRLASLLQLSGSRPVPAGDRFEQARAAAREVWRQELRLAKRRRNGLAIAVALGAAAVLVLAAASYRAGKAPTAGSLIATVEAGTLRVDETPRQPGDRVPRGGVVRTPAGARGALRLGPDVELRLDVDTVIRLVGDRIVALDRGAVFIDTGVERRSIEVRTAAGVARDIGTRFEVRVLGNATRLRVRDGLVQLTMRGGTHTAEPGVELLASESGVIRQPIGVAGSDWDWIALATVPFDADGKTLAAFLAWAAREGGWRIQFADAALERAASTIVIRGSIDGLTPRQALETIIPTCGLTHRIDDGLLTIERPRGR